ncbi:AAA family ATPase [Nocardioides plantarum]|uniref:AAA family ATPase n=2 Tax=Nocardioides plantarum TaxID=29299 RepID=A0ABV5KF94_9ACTN
MAPELLERLFVARDDLLTDIVDRVRRAATSQERNHTLLVGPRGAGKTHLVSLVHHRVRGLIDEGARLHVAWLPEDPWTIASHRHLLGAILERLDVPPAPTADEREHQIRVAAQAGGPVVVLLENLDQVMHQIGEDGQQRLRHLLQADRSLLLVATTTRLDRSLSEQASPFYAFFTTSRLAPLDTDEAAAMLTRIAIENGQDDLVDYLASDQGRARLRAIAHLAGGQPRMWSLLSTSLSVDGLSELVEHLIARVDDLTPYYQEQLARLSPQQRLVVAELAEADRPLHVRELAERIEADQRSVGRTMVDLLDRGWVSQVSSSSTTTLTPAATDRRRTHYELAEPMARLAFQVKDGRQQPLRLVVDFLKHWFDRLQLQVPSAQLTTAEYLSAALAAQDEPVVRVSRFLTDYASSRVNGASLTLLMHLSDVLEGREPDGLLSLPTPVRRAVEHALAGRSVVRIQAEVLVEATFAFITDGAADVDAWVERAERIFRSTPESQRFMLSGAMASWLELAGRPAAADAAWAIASAAVATYPHDVLHSALDLALTFLVTRDAGEAADLQQWASDQVAHRLADHELAAEIASIAERWRSDG